MIAIISLIVSIFSGFAAIFAIINYWGAKPELIQFSPTQADSYSAVTEDQIFYHDSNGNINYLPQGVMVHYQFLNPSPKDIAYFHLGFILNGKMEPAFTEKSVIDQTKNPNFKFFDLKNTIIIPFPKESQGIFKANSLTPIYVFLPMDSSPVPEEITFIVRFGIKKFPYIGKRNHYQTFKHKIKTTHYEEITRSNRAVMNLLKQSMPTNPKS